MFGEIIMGVIARALLENHKDKLIYTKLEVLG